MDMCRDPCPLLLIQKGFNKSVLTVSRNSDKQICLDNLISIWIRDLSWISRPVNFYLFCWLAIDVHGGTMFLLVLLDVTTEPRIHRGSSPLSRHSSRYSVHKIFFVTPFRSSSLWTYEKSGSLFCPKHALCLFGNISFSNAASVIDLFNGHDRFNSLARL